MKHTALAGQATRKADFRILSGGTRLKKAVDGAAIARDGPAQKADIQRRSRARNNGSGFIRLRQLQIIAHRVEEIYNGPLGRLHFKLTVIAFKIVVGTLQFFCSDNQLTRYTG